MTLARQLDDEVVDILGDPFPPHRARVFHVLLHNPKGKQKKDQWLMGYVVTHQSITEWCQANEMKLVNMYGGTRLAQDGETTNLF